MNKQDLYRSLNKVDDDNLERSEIGVYKKNRAWVRWVAFAACFCLIAGGLIVWGRKEESTPQAGCFDFFYEIYPTVMVNGELYEWKTTCNFLPAGCEYYGEVRHVKREIPQKNCELAAAFDIEGKIYTYGGVYVYICVTTDWLDEKIVMFVPVNDADK